MIVEKLSWKEIVAAIIVLGIGIVLLLLEIASIISSKSSFVTSQENTISINKSELLGHIRFVITILFSLTAGTLLLRKIRLGWVLAVPILLFSCFLCGYFIYFLYSMAFIDATVAILIGGFLFTTWMAGKIYRTGILMYGKKPTWKTMWKWTFKS